jgi:cyclopropane fatty-acyl-phospholipid synthase-like methyltransferase
MSQEIQNRVSGYYTEKLRKFGPTAQGVDWNSAESQNLRFQQLVKVLPEDKNADFSVLDFGCGYGAMLEFLRSHYLRMNYAGFDISNEMILKGQELFRDTTAVWHSKEETLVQVDYVIASGIFNVKMNFSKEEWTDYMLMTLGKIDQLSSKGFSFNVLTSFSDETRMKDYLYYANASFLFDYCKRAFSKYVALLHDYPLYEFTVIVRKSP